MKGLCRQLPWLIFLFGGLISSWAAWNIHAQIGREALATFQMHSKDFQNAVVSRLRGYEDLLFGIAGLYHHQAEDVTHEEFTAYVESLDIDKRFPAVDSLNYAKYFVAADRERFVSSFKKELTANDDNVVSLNLGPAADEYMVITRSYPAGTSSLGFNVMTTAHRLSEEGFPPLTAALYQPKQPVSSGFPVRTRGRASASLGVRLGVYTKDDAKTSRLAGTAGIIFNVEEFFREALPGTLAHRIAYRVENVGRIGTSAYLWPIAIFSSALNDDLPQSIAANPADVMKTSFVVPFGGSQLRVEMSEAKSLLVGKRDEALPFAVLAGGLLFFGMAGVLSRRTLERNLELTHAIGVQTMELAREVDRAKQLERELTHSIEEERRRIGFELHDDLGQRLTGMSLSFRALSETLHSVSSDLSAQAEALERNTSDAISSVRGLAHGLMPVPGGRGGLAVALEQMAASVTSPNTVCVFDFDEPVDIASDTVATNLYRIAQEALNNAIRHARATVVKIRLDDHYGKVKLIIRDNGVGFPQDRGDDAVAVQVSGAGLRIMAYRASVINYTLKVDSASGDGTTITVQEC